MNRAEILHALPLGGFWRQRPDDGWEWICEPTPESVPELRRIGVPEL